MTRPLSDFKTENTPPCVGHIDMAITWLHSAKRYAEAADYPEMRMALENAISRVDDALKGQTQVYMVPAVPPKVDLMNEPTRAGEIRA